MITTRPPEVYHYQDPLEFVSAWLAFSRGDDIPQPTNVSAEALNDQVGRVIREVVAAALAGDGIALAALCRAEQPIPPPTYLSNCDTLEQVRVNYAARMNLQCYIETALNAANLLGDSEELPRLAASYSRKPPRLSGPLRFRVSLSVHRGLDRLPEGVPNWLQIMLCVSYIPYRCRSARSVGQHLHSYVNDPAYGIELLSYYPSAVSWAAFEVIRRARADWRDHLTPEGEALCRRIEAAEGG